MNQQKDKNWWGRNWKWFVPVGCLSTLILFAACIALILYLVAGITKSSDAYKKAVVIAKAHPVVQESIGTPIEEGFFTSGSINISGPTGQADLAIPVSGPDGKATLHVVAAKSAGQWTFSTLGVELKETGQRIDLLVQEPEKK